LSTTSPRIEPTFHARGSGARSRPIRTAASSSEMRQPRDRCRLPWRLSHKPALRRFRWRILQQTTDAADVRHARPAHLEPAPAGSEPAIGDSSTRQTLCNSLHATRKPPLLASGRKCDPEHGVARAPLRRWHRWSRTQRRTSVVDEIAPPASWCVLDPMEVDVRPGWWSWPVPPDAIGGCSCRAAATARRPQPHRRSRPWHRFAVGLVWTCTRAACWR